MFIRVGQPDRARDDFEASLRKLDSLVDGSTDPDLMYLRATVNSNLAIIAIDTKDMSAAKLYLGRARQLLEDLFRDVSRDVVYVAAYVIVLNTLGVVNLDDNEVDRASELFKEAVDFSRRLLAKLPDNLDYREGLARALANYGTTLRMKGYLKRAAEPLAEALKIREELARDHPDVLPYSVELCWSYSQTGRLHDARGDFRAANDWFTKAIDRLTSDPAILAGDSHAQPAWQRLSVSCFSASAAQPEQGCGRRPGCGHALRWRRAPADPASRHRSAVHLRRRGPQGSRGR